MVMKMIGWTIMSLLVCSFVYQTTIQTGKASYYHNKFEGKRTSSGEVFRQDSLTAAHKNLPFGTLLRVKNLKNDSIVIVKVNDRLSQKSGHIIDLSLKAAQKLNFVQNGITTVTIEKIN
jgi:rare lipoprotein A